MNLARHSVAFVARPDTRTNYPQNAELYLYSGGKVERLTNNDTPETAPYFRQMVPQGYSTDRKKMAYLYQCSAQAPDLYVSDLYYSSPVTITNANPWLKEKTLSKAEVLQWKGKGGMMIDGLFYNPVKRKRGKMPMILQIHGGPAGNNLNIFTEDIQIFTNVGYAVLAPNPRGSIGYGDEILRGLMGEVGDGEFVDNMKGVDFVIANKNVDPDRVGIRGWSWGGVSASYVITQTQRFKAASIGAMVGNWAAETGPGYNFDVSLWYIGGTPWTILKNGPSVHRLRM